MSVTADRPEEATGATVTSGGAPGRCSLREIGAEAVWSLSTAKPGNGVEQIRDDNVDTYWQSDGGQPHLINVQFHKKMSIVEIAFYLDYNLDESYTPKKLSVCRRRRALRRVARARRRGRTVRQPPTSPTLPHAAACTPHVYMYIIYILRRCARARPSMTSSRCRRSS